MLAIWRDYGSEEQEPASNTAGVPVVVAYMRTTAPLVVYSWMQEPLVVELPVPISMVLVAVLVEIESI